jgi:uncharacterized protein (DUF2252 family)
MVNSYLIGVGKPGFSLVYHVLQNMIVNSLPLKIILDQYGKEKSTCSDTVLKKIGSKEANGHESVGVLRMTNRQLENKKRMVFLCKCNNF